MWLVKSVYDKSRNCSLANFKVGFEIFECVFEGGLKYTRETQDEDALEGNLDADYVDNVDTRKFIFGCVYSLWHGY